MKKIHFPYLATALGITFLPIIILGNTVGEDGVRAVPLLSLLIMNEFAFFAAAGGIFIGVQHVKAAGSTPVYMLAILCCVALLAAFTVLGIELWPT